ncbi:MAG TPA: hydrolase [Deltaproteobacteria bacterium]|nr:hydrolase [Deltaproteobacteria bacterium]
MGMVMKTRKQAGGRLKSRLFCLFLLLVLSACTVRTAPPPPVSPHPRAHPEQPAKLAPLGFTIQAGAFSNVGNASRLTDYLNEYNLDAYYFVYERDLYKVRFGDFPTREEALAKAKELEAQNIIEEFYIVRPDQYTLASRARLGDRYVRTRLVQTARSFLGVPYKWGGNSPKDGFDCSGLAMSVYRLNGFSLPRTSRAQFMAGNPVNPKALSEGDLVFFDTSGKGQVSHVGIYAGGGRFIHAPRAGRQVSVDSLDNAYYRRRFLGGRSYL